MNLADTYNSIADDWHRDHLHHDWWHEGMDHFIGELPSGAHVLDVGCGSGIQAKYLLDRKVQVTGIDISKGMLKFARSYAPEGTFLLLSMENLPEFEGEFDGVMSQASLLHIPKKEAAGVVKKMADKLKPGGVLYLVVKEVRSGEPEEQLLREDTYDYEHERFFSFFTFEELSQYFANSGIKETWRGRKAGPSGKTIWLQILGKKC